MGRSRGGLTSKMHALVDADGRPVALRLTGGQVHDSKEAEALLEAMPKGAAFFGNKRYDSNAIGEAAAAQNVWANIPSRFNRKQRFGDASRKPLADHYVAERHAWPACVNIVMSDTRWIRVTNQFLAP